MTCSVHTVFPSLVVLVRGSLSFPFVCVSALYMFNHVKQHFHLLAKPKANLPGRLSIAT